MAAWSNYSTRGELQQRNRPLLFPVFFVWCFKRGWAVTSNLCLHFKLFIMITDAPEAFKLAEGGNCPVSILHIVLWSWPDSPIQIKKTAILTKAWTFCFCASWQVQTHQTPPSELVKMKHIQKTRFRKFISSLLFGIQIFIDLYSIYRYVYVTQVHCKVKDKPILLTKKKEIRKIDNKCA